MSDTCGPTSGTPFAQYDHEQRCWRTSEVTSLWALPLSSLTLPTWGCLHAGELYELPTPALPTIERGFSSLPMPMARDYKDETFPPRLWGPKAYESELPTAIARHLLPTPAVNDMGAGKDPEAWQEWAARQKAADGRPAPHGKSLEQEALKVLPTPRAQNGEQRNQTIYRRTGPQNLENALDGVITPQPSPVGSASLDDPHQPQLFSVGTAHA
jgi:hypothetical protein